MIEFAAGVFPVIVQNIWKPIFIYYEKVLGSAPRPIAFNDTFTTRISSPNVVGDFDILG
jgi:hypothetical protein